MEQSSFAGTYTAMLPSASSPGRDITLVLNPDGSAELSTDSFLCYQSHNPIVLAATIWYTEPIA